MSNTTPGLATCAVYTKVRTGSGELNHTELIRNSLIIFVSSGAPWFEEGLNHRELMSNFTTGLNACEQVREC